MADDSASSGGTCKVADRQDLPIKVAVRRKKILATRRGKLCRDWVHQYRVGDQTLAGSQTIQNSITILVKPSSGKARLYKDEKGVTGQIINRFANTNPNQHQPCSRMRKLKSYFKTSLIAPKATLAGLCGAVGIDVSKSKFNVCYLADSQSRAQNGEFVADASGHAKFLAWLERVGAGQSVHLCLEETGCYGQALAAFLHEAGHHVSVVNAALIKNYGRSLNVRTKNDVVDARLIAQYTLERVPQRWIPLAPQHQALRNASRRRDQINEFIIKEKNHLEASPCPEISEMLRTHIEQLKACKAEITKLMARLVAQDPQLARNIELLMTIPGIGRVTAINLLAELPSLDGFTSARQLCAYAGLTPRENTSGSSLHGRPRLCKQGRGVLRRIMFMPALSLMGSKSGPLRVFADRLLGNDKKPACVVGALMRKLIALVFAILRSGKPFDPLYAHSFGAAAPQN
jgi:transposase